MPQLDVCKQTILEMLRRSQTKVIFPVMTLAMLEQFVQRDVTTFSHVSARQCYLETICRLHSRLGHNLHIGARYETAYCSRNLTRYRVLRALADEQFQLTEEFQSCAVELISWIPVQIEDHIQKKLGIIPLLHDYAYRHHLAEQPEAFLDVLRQHIGSNPINFEIFSFAIIRVHLEKFACRIYRDSRGAAHDRGVDLSTNFGVVYQIKKLRVQDRRSAEAICDELKLNFDQQRFDDGKIVLIIDDVAKDVRNYLIDMRVQAISKDDILRLAEHFEDVEDREKVLRVVHEEFRREYQSSVRSTADGS